MFFLEGKKKRSDVLMYLNNFPFQELPSNEDSHISNLMGLASERNIGVLPRKFFTPSLPRGFRSLQGPSFGSARSSSPVPSFF